MTRKFVGSKEMLAALSFGLLVSCATGQNIPSTTNPASRVLLSIERVEALHPGKDNEESAKQLFGEPDMKVTDPEPGIGDVWLYFDPGTKATRVSLQFDSKSTILLAAAWFVRGNSPEENLKTVIAKFPNAHFKKREAKQIVPDYIPDEAYLEDRKLGVQIEYYQSNSRVHSITWTAPKTQN